MGGPKPQASVNRLAQVGQGQQQALQGNIMGGLTQGQSNAQNAFNSAFGGYQNLLTGLQAPQGGGGGGGQAAALAAIQGLQGPSMSNPWAGQLGADIRARGESLLPAFYDRIKAEQGRLQNVQGGYNPGYTAQMSKLARDQAQAAQSGQLEREISLGEKKAAVDRANAAAQSQFQMQKAGMLAGLGRGGGGGGADDNFRQQMAVLGAMGGLRGQTPGEVGMYLQSGLGNVGLGNQQFNQFAQYNPASVPGWQRALGAVGQVAGGVLGSGFNPFGGGGGGGGQGSYAGGWS